MKKLENKTAVVTGGNSGIGRATAQLFASEGGQVAIFGRNQTTLEDTVSEIGVNAIAVQGDVTDMSDLDTLFDKTSRSFGNIDILLVNAGITKHGLMEETSETDFDHQFNINFKGAYFTFKKALPVLNDGASVILTTSCLDEMGMATLSVYSATKAALRSLARSMSAELVNRNIRVNALSPGPVDTSNYSRKNMNKDELKEHMEGIKQAVRLGRLGKPEELAKPALFLAADDSSFMLGSEVVVDGGMKTL